MDMLRGPISSHRSNPTQIGQEGINLQAALCVALPASYDLLIYNSYFTNL